MRLFFDTCTLVDYLFNRQHSRIVEEILDMVDKGKWECYISVGSFYTLAYLIENHLKQNGFSDKQLRVGKQREMLTNISWMGRPL